MRLIDADRLKARMAAFMCSANTGYLLAENIAMMINQADTVEAVEVVRCKDCKHAKELGEAEKKIYLAECLICTSGEATIDGYNIVMPEHYCSCGKRRCE